MTAPVLAVGDGALGFWKAIRDVFPDTKEQRCWWHKIGNVLAALPKSAHPAAKKALAEIYNAENKAAAVKPPTTSRPSTGRSGPRPWPRSSTTSTC
jgi:transposase-like protein